MMPLPESAGRVASAIGPPRPRLVGGWFVTFIVVFILIDAWWRGHTIGPTIRDALGFAPYPVVVGRAEPIDCDEAAYAYIGSNLAHGAVMYRDLSENKPPLGYWLYALTTALGGRSETAIRLMPLVPVALTLALLGVIARQLRGGLLAPALAMGTYILLSTDPYLFGNGANMEHFLNLFSVLGLAAIVRAWRLPAGSRARFGWLILAGSGVALGTLVKQVAVIQGPIFAIALALQSGTTWRLVLRDWWALVLGFVGPVAMAALILVTQGAGRDAWADVVAYGSALATIKVPDPGAPSPLIRWLTGNAAPDGRLPYPFRGVDPMGMAVRGLLRVLGQTPPPTGETDYLVWWGLGSWPLWLTAIPVAGWLVRPRRKLLADVYLLGIDRLIASWTLGLSVETILPGLYWQHYYLLPTPGLSLLIGLAIADASRGSTGPGLVRRVTSIASALLLMAALAGTAWIQVGSYLWVPPERLTSDYKGGRQWVQLRDLTARIADQARVAWPDGADPGLFLWGWQSPLHFYGGWQSPTRHFFTDPLLLDYARGYHQTDPRVRPRVERIIRDLEARPPGLIFITYPPFPELRAFLRARGYRFAALPGLPPYSPEGFGLWVDSAHFAAFEAAGARPSALPPHSN